MVRRTAAFVFLLCLIVSLPALARDNDDKVPASPPPTATAASTTPDATSTTSLPAWAVDRPMQRPLALTAMYGAYGTLQVMDIVSTRKAMAAGAHETNPLLGSGSTRRMVAAKAATGAMSIYFAEKMWKKSRIGAIVTMAAINGLTATVVARNVHYARR